MRRKDKKGEKKMKEEKEVVRERQRAERNNSQKE